MMTGEWWWGAFDGVKANLKEDVITGANAIRVVHHIRQELPRVQPEVCAMWPWMTRMGRASALMRGAGG